MSICATEVSFEAFRDDVLQVVHCFTERGVKLVRSKSAVLHPGVSADIYVDGVHCGYFGKIHPQVASNFDIEVDCMYCELFLDRLSSVEHSEIQFKPFAKYPSISRDFAFVCAEEVAVQDILDEFLALPLVESASLFDVYRSEQLGAENKSLAVNVVFRDRNKTLQDSDIEKQIGKVLKAVKDKYGAVLR